MKFLDWFSVDLAVDMAIGVVAYLWSLLSHDTQVVIFYVFMSVLVWLFVYLFSAVLERNEDAL